MRCIGPLRFWLTLGIAAVASGGCGSADPFACAKDGTCEIGVLRAGSAVSGVSYETPTYTGRTDADGMFAYKDGETVTFSLGDTSLGEALGKDDVTVFDLVPGAFALTTYSAISRALSQPCHPFVQVLNRAVLLQTLDRDGDPDNGIEISAATAALFEGVNVRFEQYLYSFRRDLAFRSILARANEDGTLEGHGSVRSLAQATAHLYGALGIDSKLFGRDVCELDMGADGTVEATQTTVVDESARVIRDVYDDGADGTPESITTTYYDADGQETRRENDLGADGVADWTSTTEYDEDGNLVRSEYDENADGEPEYSQVSAYDAIGRLVRRQESRTDGSSITTTWAYDDELRTIREELDSDDDVTVDRVVVSVLDDNGFAILREDDLGADGTINDRQMYVYDARGNRTESERDSDGDGMLNSADRTEYNDRCRPTLHTADNDADGVVDQTTTYTYDDNGQQVRYALDSNGDGTEDYVETNEYDDGGNLVLHERDSDANNVVDYRITYTNDASGNVLMTDQDNDANGAADTSQTCTYQAVTEWWVAMSRFLSD